MEFWLHGCGEDPDIPVICVSPDLESSGSLLTKMMSGDQRAWASRDPEGKIELVRISGYEALDFEEATRLSKNNTRTLVVSSAKARRESCGGCRKSGTKPLRGT